MPSRVLYRIIDRLSGSPPVNGTSPNGHHPPTSVAPAPPPPRQMPPYVPLHRWRRYRYGLDTSLLFFGRKNPFTIRTAAEGVAIFGDMGSGKTSGSGSTLARAFLKAGMGGLVLCKKKDECDTWIDYAKQTGRTHSLLIVHPSNPWKFNILDHQLTRAGEGAGYTENAVNLFTLLSGETGCVYAAKGLS